MKPEVDILKERMNIISTDSIAHTEVYEGTLSDRNIVLVESGIGKVNATIITALLIERYDAGMIINTGVAGSLSGKLNVTDMVVSTEVRHQDVDATEFGYVPGQVPGMPEYYTPDDRLIEKSMEALSAIGDISGHRGLIVSGDSFVADSGQKQAITGIFDRALAVDMESAAIAQTCHQFSVPFVIVRAISDKADDRADMSYDTFLGKACVNSSEVVKSIVKDL